MVLCAIVMFAKFDEHDKNEVMNLFGLFSISVIDARHFAFLKTLDLSLWFTLQFVRQTRFPNTILWQKIKRQ